MTKLTIAKLPGDLLPRLLGRTNFGSVLQALGGVDPGLARHLDLSTISSRVVFLLSQGYEHLLKGGSLMFDQQAIIAKLTPVVPPLKRIQVLTLPVDVERFLTAPFGELVGEVKQIDPWAVAVLKEAAPGQRAVFLLYAGLASLLNRQVAEPKPQGCAPAKPTQEAISPSPPPAASSPRTATQEPASAPDGGSQSAIAPGDPFWETFGSQ